MMDAFGINDQLLHGINLCVCRSTETGRDFLLCVSLLPLKKTQMRLKNVQYISSSCISLILLRCLKRKTFANVYDVHLVINMVTEVVLHGLGFA